MDHQISSLKSSSKNLSNENIHTLCLQKNWHFRSCFALKTTKTPLFVFITEILWRTFWYNNWRSVFDVVKILRFFLYISISVKKFSWSICRGFVDSEFVETYDELATGSGAKLRYPWPNCLWNCFRIRMQNLLSCPWSWRR